MSPGSPARPRSAGLVRSGSRVISPSAVSARAVTRAERGDPEQVNQAIAMLDKLGKGHVGGRRVRPIPLLRKVVGANPPNGV